MSSQPATNPTPASASPSALRVVLFGMPDAGKSSLLGALAQAAQTQERTFGGRLTDLTNGLAELQHRVYDGRPRETLAETAAFPVAIDPFEGARPDPRRREEAVLIDCDGRVANDILTRRKQLAEEAPAGSLVGEILSADALVLVVDAGANVVQVEADLSEFVRFLRLFERERGRRSEVGGLPVILVLSKADLLAKPEDSAAEWTARVEQKKAEVGKRFREFLESEDDDRRTAFGEIDLSVAATAVRWPALAGSPARLREPWHVAELFRRGLAAARDFRARRTASGRRLTWTVLASSGFLALLAVATTVLVLNRESHEVVALASNVENYRSREGLTASVRLAEPLQRKIGELSDFKSDRDFVKLASDQQKYVTDRLAELEDYREYKDRLLQARAPADVRSNEELQSVERALRSELAPPEKYATEWRQTEAAVLRDKRLDDIKALRRAADEVEEFYRALIARASKLLSFADRENDAAPLPWPRWLEVVDALLQDATPPFRPTDKLRDSRAVPQSRAATYGAVWNYPPVEAARGQWERTRAKLERLRDLASAFGLTGGNRPAVLKLPERFAADQSSDVLAKLKAEYPRFGEWSLADTPDAAVPEVKAAAQASYRRLVTAGRAVVLRLFDQIAPDGKETPSRWRAVADSAQNSADLREWRHLANVVLRFADPGAEDPVAALASFLRRERFDLDVRGFRLAVPDELKGQRYRPQSPLTLGEQSSGGPERKLTFRLDGDGVRDSRLRLTTYTYAVDGTTSFAFAPGDAFWADVPLRDAAGREWKFSWWSNGSRTLSYQLERIELPPRLHAADQKIENGDLADGVVLTPVPAGAVPRVPDLLPDVRR